MKKMILLTVLFVSLTYSQGITPTKEYGYTASFSNDTTLVTTHFRTITIRDNSNTAFSTARSVLVTIFAHPTDTIKVGFDGDTTAYTTGKLWVYPGLTRQFGRRAKTIHLKSTGTSSVHTDVEY